MRIGAGRTCVSVPRLTKRLIKFAAMYFEREPSAYRAPRSQALRTHDRGCVHSRSRIPPVSRARRTATKCPSDIRTLPDPPSSTLLDPPRPPLNCLETRSRSSWILSPRPLLRGRQRRLPRRGLGERSGRVRMSEVHFVAVGLVLLVSSFYRLLVGSCLAHFTKRHTESPKKPRTYFPPDRGRILVAERGAFTNWIEEETQSQCLTT